MNPNDDMTQPAPNAQDRDISDALASLRDLKPPQGLREASRARLAEALANANGQARVVPIWRRRIAVPFPVAALFMVSLLALSAMQFQKSAGSKSEVESPPVSGREASPVQNSPSLRRGQPVRTTAAAEPGGCELLFRQERLVIAGLGTLQSVQSYQCKSEIP